MGHCNEVDILSPQRAGTSERGFTHVWQLGRGTKRAQTLAGSAASCVNSILWQRGQWRKLLSLPVMMSPQTWAMLFIFLLYLTSESLSECAVCLSKDPGYHFPLMPRTKILELPREHFAPTNDQILKPQVIDLVPLTPGWSSLFLPFPMRFVQ